MKTGPASVSRADRTLTRSLDYTEEGLAMDATLTKPCLFCGTLMTPAASTFPKAWAARRFCNQACGIAYRTDDLPTRLWSRVTVLGPDDCWLWTGAATDNGYGVIGRGGGNVNGNVCTHVAAYEDQVGPIPNGYQVDHLCRVTLCCNPAHLEAVTQQENLRRQAAALQAAKTTCTKGLHPWPESRGQSPGGMTYCRMCRQESGRNAHQQRQAGRDRERHQADVASGMERVDTWMKRRRWTMSHFITVVDRSPMEGEPWARSACGYAISWGRLRTEPVDDDVIQCKRCLLAMEAAA